MDFFVVEEESSPTGYEDNSNSRRSILKIFSSTPKLNGKTILAMKLINDNKQIGKYCNEW